MANIWRPAPSYHFRKDENLWRIVAPYVQQNDLYSACLVSSLFHHIFSPYLWANPACRFGSDCDGVYLALTRFKRLLKRTRLDVRRLAHTLHIPPAQPELYDGPQEGWLRDILDRLPSLQALIVSNLSFFDHQSLQVVHRSSGTPFENPTQYVLRLLIASHCENTTGTSLAVALSHFPDLIYLDLSSTRGARHPSVLRQIASLSYLRVLKLSHCGLRDDHVDYFAFGSSSHIRSLDVSHNFLTEKGITNLIGGLPGANLPFRWCENTLYNDYSSLSIRRKSVADTPILGPLDGLESFVVQGLTSGFDGHLFIQDGLPAKFSHLYLACNDITVGGLSKLLQYPKLQFLDCGSLYCLEQPVELLSPGLSGSRRATYLEKLDPSSFIQAFKNVTSLRLHHAIITEYPFSDEDTTICPDSPKEGIFELSSDGLRYELDATNPDTSAVLHELEGSVGATELQADVPQYELSADAATSIPKPLSILNSNTQRMNSRPHDRNGTTLESASPSTESNSARLLTPQSLEKAQSNAPKVMVSDGFPTRDQLGHCQYTPSDIRSKNISAPPSLVRPTKEVPVSGHEEHLNSYAVHEDFSRNLTQRESGTLNPQEIVIKLVQRQSQLQAERHPGRLKPSMLPNLETLILTDVPTMTRKCRVVEALRMFMQECAEQDELARLEARIANGTKPSRSEIKLKRLVLEMSSSPETLEPPKSPHSPRGKRGDSFTKTTKSSTEDADSEMFMEASEMDFTFFGEDDNSLLVSEGRVDSPRVVDDGMIFRETPTSPVDLEHPIDVISDLSSFRREKRAAHEKAMGLGMDRDPVRIALLGHWKGEVTVIRQQ